MTTYYWNGPVSNDYYDINNWSYDVLPQSNLSQKADVSGTQDKPALAIANAASPNQIAGLTVGNGGTLKITAQAGDGFAGNVFATQGFQIFQTGQLIVDTPSRVELGGFNEMSGTLTIMNNNGNVTLDFNRLSGHGTLNLVNSVLGNTQAPIAIDEGMNVTLQDNSVLYTKLYADGATVTFDPSTTNTLVLDGQESTINTAFVGVSENTHFAINGARGAIPVSAYFTHNSDSSYSLTINTQNGKTLTLANISLAKDFVPGNVSITRNSSGDYILSESNISGSVSNYQDTTAHQNLQSLANVAQNLGGDTSQYSSTPYIQDNPQETNNFTGTGNANQPAEWSDANNWQLGFAPQQNGSAGANISSTDNPLYVVADQPNIAQISFLTVGQNATFEITAPQTTNPKSYVFTTQGFQVVDNGNFIINTAGRVDLGSINHLYGTMTIENNNNNVILDQTYINGSGTLNLVNTTLGSADMPLKIEVGQLNLSNDSTVYAAPFSTGASVVNFDNSANEYVLSSKETSISTAFTNVSSNTSFAINGTTGVAPVSASWAQNENGSYTLSVNLDNGQTVTLKNVSTASGFMPGATTFTRDQQQNWVVHTASNNACFLEGTMIRTDRGDVAIENLAIGDMVAVQDPTDNYRPITWIGARSVRAKIGAPEAQAGYPVRIVAGALDEHLPRVDLLVTPEHCLFLDGAFVPVRMLVNGTSVFYDRTVTSYRYFHVETAQHSIIFAENVATESYLDTGNRRNFTDGTVVSLHGAPRKWSEAAAPLRTDRNFVEPLSALISARASLLGFAPIAAPSVSHDAALRLLDQNGQSLRMLRSNGTTVMFSLPPNITVVKIVTRASSPADTIGPFVDDRRNLGVLVGRVTVWDAHETRKITDHLNKTEALGWHEIEHSSMRWTNGHAHLNLGHRTATAASILSIEIIASGPYILHHDAAIGMEHDVPKIGEM